MTISLLSVLLLTGVAYGIPADMLMGSLNTNPISREAVGYLTRYGYLKEDESIQSFVDQFRDGDDDPPIPVPEVAAALKSALKSMQQFANISATGELDQTTLEVMRRPRCGMRDILEDDSTDPEKYVLWGMKWVINPVTWRVSLYTPDLSIATVDLTLQRAINAWDSVCGISFRQQSFGGTPIIDIRFTSGNHGDGSSFDGPNGILAHAFYPSNAAIGGDTHFDEAEQWTVNTPSGINLFQVALHEFGHAIGLMHSNVATAVMAPYYTGFNPNYALTSDDIAGCRALYG